MKSIYPFFLGAIFVLILAILLRVYGMNVPIQQVPLKEPIGEVTETPILTPTPSMKPSNVKGTIEGSLSYPSEGIPQNMIVCAENESLKDPICTSQKINDSKYTYGTGYKLQVPEGKYFVYAKLPENDYSAYYSNFVTCGLSVNCTDHTPIEVTVRGNQVTTNVDPGDWYRTQPSM
jgi:hypothetical protein